MNFSNLYGSPWQYKKVERTSSPTDTLALYLRRLLVDGDFIIRVTGNRNAGKSWTCASLAEDIIPGWKYEEHFHFTLESLYAALDTPNEGAYQVEVADDFGSEIDGKRCMDEVIRQFNYVQQKGRTLHRGLFITTPNSMNIDKDTRERTADHYMNVVGRNSSEGVTFVNFYKLQVNDRIQKTFYHYLCMGPNGRLNSVRDGMRVKQFRIKKPSTAFCAWYIPRRDQLAIDQVKESKKSTEKTTLKQDIQALAAKALEDIDKYLTKYKGRTSFNCRLFAMEHDLEPRGEKVLMLRDYLMSEDLI